LLKSKPLNIPPQPRPTTIKKKTVPQDTTQILPRDLVQSALDIVDTIQSRTPSPKKPVPLSETLSWETEKSLLMKQIETFSIQVSTLEEKLLNEYSEKSRLKKELNQALEKNSEMELELQEYNELMQEMKEVALESETKDQLIQNLEMKLESMEESLLSIQVKLYQAEQENTRIQQLMKQEYCLVEKKIQKVL
jgi:hypothetical protein